MNQTTTHFRQRRRRARPPADALPSDSSLPSAELLHARVATARPNPARPGPEVMAASTIEGDPVVNPAGEDLGTLTEVMFDVHSGCIAYAVLSFGGFLGIGEKLYAIPWSALTLDSERKCFVLDVSRERLDASPGFDKDQWPTCADPHFADAAQHARGREPALF